MKAKVLIFIFFVLQFCFLFVLVSYNKDVSELIEVGVERLKANYPSEAPTHSIGADGSSILKTSGDFFDTARQDYLFQTAVSFFVAITNIILLVCLLMMLRKKRSVSNADVSES